MSDPIMDPESVDSVLRALAERYGGRLYVIAIPPKDPPDAPAGLESFGEPVFHNIYGLVTFYLVGLAYHAGFQSLGAVAAELERRDMAGTLPANVPSSKGTLSELLRRLAVEVFAPFFGSDKCRFTLIRGAEGGRPGSRRTGSGPGKRPEISWNGTEWCRLGRSDQGG